MESCAMSLHHDVQNTRRSKKGEFLLAACSHLPTEEKRLETQWAGWMCKVLADRASNVSTKSYSQSSEPG